MLRDYSTPKLFEYWPFSLKCQKLISRIMHIRVGWLMHIWVVLIQYKIDVVSL